MKTTKKYRSLLIVLASAALLTAGARVADTATGRTAAPSGSYVDRTRVTPSSAESYNVQRERTLWDYLEAVRLRNA
jgi:hypothetical protein